METKSKQMDLAGVSNAAFTTSTGDVSVVCDSVSPADGLKSVHGIQGQKTQPSGRYGCGHFKPSFLQCFNRIAWFFFWSLVFSFTQGLLGGLVSSAIPALEKQLKLPSKKSALIASSQDIGALCAVLFVSFIGARYNKARWIASGALLMSFGSFLFMVPHFVTNYQYEDVGPSGGPKDTCDAFGNASVVTPACSKSSNVGEHYLAILMIAEIINGIGNTAMLSLQPVYLTENEDKSIAAVHVGCTFAAGGFGVATGFLAAGQVLQKVFVDFDRIDQDSLGFDASDPRWVGSWWLGFILTTVLFAVFSVPLFGFPKRLPGYEKEEEEKEETEEKSLNVKEFVAGFFKAFPRLLLNPIFMLITVAACIEVLCVFGFMSFAFKYLSEQYNLSFDDAGILLGGLTLFGSCGMIVGGAVIRFLKLEIKGMMRLNFIGTSLAALLGLAYLTKCSDPNLAGLHVPYTNESIVDGGFTAECNSLCNCESMAFRPVCGKDNTVYYSACHAGCTQSPNSSLSPYSNCSCVARAGDDVESNWTGTAVGGRCKEDCNSIYILTPCLYLMIMFALATTTPAAMATMRCTDKDIQPFALGLQWLMLRLLGFIPGPVLVGAVLDQACLIWQGGTCDETGYCALYSHSQLSISVALYWIIGNVLGCLMYLTASIISSRNNEKSFTLTTDEKPRPV